jgi:hypothetical protein
MPVNTSINIDTNTSIGIGIERHPNVGVTRRASIERDGRGHWAAAKRKGGA